MSFEERPKDIFLLRKLKSCRRKKIDDSIPTILEECILATLKVKKEGEGIPKAPISGVYTCKNLRCKLEFVLNVKWLDPKSYLNNTLRDYTIKM